MQHNRVRLSKTASAGLDRISRRLGIRKNLICRVALLHSLNIGSLDFTDEVENDGLEFNLPTLFGAFTDVFIDMIKVVQLDSDDEAWPKFANLHIDRGVEFLQTEAMNLPQFAKVLERASRA